MEWIKTNEREPISGDFYYCKVDTKRDNILKTIVEWVKYPNGNYDWDLKNVEHLGNEIGEESEVIEWLDEDNIFLLITTYGD